MNLVGAVGAAFFAEATLRGYLQTHRPLGAAFFAEQMWVVVAYLIRRPARTVSRRWGDWVLAFRRNLRRRLVPAGWGPSPMGRHHRAGPSTGRSGDLCGFVPRPGPLLRLRCRRPRTGAKRPLRRRPPSDLRLLPPASARVRAAEHLAAQRPRDGGRVGLQCRPCRRRGPPARDERGVPAYRNRVRWRLVPGVW